MAVQGKKRIWVLAKRMDLEDQKEELKDVQFHRGIESSIVDQKLRTVFSIPDNLVLKLRNHRGSLIPINSSIMSNAENVPYALEVVHVAQNIKPLPRTIMWASYNESIAANLHNIVNRIEKLEGYATDLKTKRHTMIANDVESMDRKLEFLNKRFEEADGTSWKGMFKRHPMW